MLRRQLVDLYPTLLRFALSIVRDQVYAEDLVQETQMRALTHLDSFAWGTNFEAWLFTILRNYHRQQYRKRKNEVQDPEGDYARARPINANQHHRVELREVLTELEKLPEPFREVFKLCMIDGYDQTTVADMLELPPGTVKSRLFRAKAALERGIKVSEGLDVNRVVRLYQDGASASEIAEKLGVELADVMSHLIVVSLPKKKKKKKGWG